MLDVDRFSKMANFISYKRTFDVVHIAKLFFWEIDGLHRIRISLTSDCDVKFVDYFWREL